MAILEYIKFFFQRSKDTHNQHATENQNEEIYDALTPKIINNDSTKEYFKAPELAF